MAESEESTASETPAPDLDGLQRVQSLVASLHDRAGAAPTPLLQEAISELETTVEELSVAMEELHEQHDELVATRQTLESERTYFQELFDLAPDAYLLTDDNGLIHGANRAAAQLLGREPAHLLGRPLAAFVPPDDRDDFRSGLRAAAEAGERVDWTFGVTPHRRAPIILSAHVTGDRDDRGGNGGLRWQLRDVTGAREAQEALRTRFDASREETESLREKDRWKDAFMAAAAHDLRSPLTIIDAAAQTLAQRRELDAATRDRLVGVVTTQSRRLQRLLDDLLDLDRFTRGTITAQREPVDLGELVPHAVALLEIHTHPVTVDAGQLIAHLDATRVEQIVGNLVGNAVHHTPAGTPIHVRVEATGTGVRLTVEDEGPGLDPEIGTEIFQPFVTQERHDKSTRGTGLGLSLVKLFAELHGGDVQARNRDGGGAEFVVELPARVSP